MEIQSCSIGKGAINCQKISWWFAQGISWETTRKSHDCWASKECRQKGRRNQVALILAHKNLGIAWGRTKTDW